MLCCNPEVKIIDHDYKESGYKSVVKCLNDGLALQICIRTVHFLAELRVLHISINEMAIKASGF